MNQQRREEGFILIDALAGAAILAFAGTVVLMIGNAAMQRAASDLDRSVALLELDGLAAEVRLVGSDKTSIELPGERDGLHFEIKAASGILQNLSVRPASGTDGPLFSVEVAGPRSVPAVEL